MTGIYAGCRDTFRAANRFYDAQRLHDIQVLSTYGLTDDDVAALKHTRGVDVVQPERSQSVEADVKGTDKTVTINEIGVNGLDQPYLQDGRIPSKAGEVAVTKVPRRQWHGRRRLADRHPGRHRHCDIDRFGYGLRR